jgi:hypothetical protein
MLSIFREMRAAGLSKWEIVGEFLAAACVILLPILMLFIGHAFGLE